MRGDLSRVLVVSPHKPVRLGEHWEWGPPAWDAGSFVYDRNHV